MNLGALREYTHKLCRKNPNITSAELDQAVNDALKWLCVGEFIDAFRRRRVMHFPQLDVQADATLVTGQEVYAIPVNWYRVEIVEHRYNTSPEQWMTLAFKHPKNYVGYQPTSGRPYIYTWFENSIRIRNIPSAAENGQTLRIWGYRLPDALTADGQSPEIPDNWHFLIPYLAAETLALRHFDPEFVSNVRSAFAQTLATTTLPGSDGDFNQGVRANGGGR